MKNLAIILLTTLLFSVSPACALEHGRAEFVVIPADYSKVNLYTLKRNARENMTKWQLAKNKSEKEKYIQATMHDCFLITKIEPKDINAYVYLARIYDEIGNYHLTMENFYKAVNISPYDPQANFYFGEYYFKRQDYLLALDKYKIAYNHGYQNHFILNWRMAVIYEKLADLKMSKTFYQRAYSLNSSDKTLTDKIRLLDEVIYNNPQYH